LKTESVRVIGEGSLPAGLRSDLAGRGISIADDADVIIDASNSVWDSWSAAKQVESNRPSQWICVVAPEAGSMESAWSHGARVGFAKALGREWSETRTRVIQLHPSLPVELALESVLAELEAGNAVTEVLLSAGDHRRVLELSVEDRPEKGTLPDGQVILVTGGGRGITARVALEFARRAPCTLVLVGRTQAGEEPLDEAVEKKRIKQAIKAEGKRVTPAEVEKQLKPLRSAEEIRQTLVALQAAGAIVDYRTCDLANPDAVMGLVADTEATHGRIDGCIHGAGVEESRLIADKDDKAFHRVFDGKAVGGLALVGCLPTMSWFLSMGSVAGRFGNEGQVDYSAANEAMAQICLLRDRSLHMDWTAWADVGMAVRGGMKTLLEGRGVEMLPADAGAALCVDLVAAGTSGELVVSGGLGGLLPVSGHAWVDGADLDGDDWVVTRTVSVETDAWILDHAIGGIPILPGVAGIELMMAVAELVCPGLPYAGVEDLSFQAPVKLYRGESIRLEIRARALSPGRVRCSLHSERTVKTGNLLRTDHFEGTICLGKGSRVQALPPAFFGDHSLSAEEIYSRFFHGPSFQVLTGARDVSTDGLLADGAVDHSAIAPGLLTDPLVLEAAFQAAGLHSLVVDGVLALPAAIEGLTVNRRFKPGTAIELTVRHRGEVYDVDVVQSGKTIMSLRGFSMIQRGPLPEGERFTPPAEGWPQTSFGSATVAEGQPGLSPTEIAQLRARGTTKRQEERIAGRVAAKRAVQALTGAAPGDIRIESLPSGAPQVRIAGQEGPKVSISHSEGVAIAIARRDGRIGVDLETIEERPASFAREWFTAGEQARYGHNPRALTAAWAAKESVLKALGTGMALHPREVEVVDLSERHLRVVLHGRAHAKHLELGGGDLALALSISGERVLVTAILAA
jgi:phosphopantetheine--protein transferase-like protein